MLELTINRLLSSKDYILTIFSPSMFPFDKNGTFFAFKPFNFSFNYTNNRPKDQIEHYSAVGLISRVFVLDPG